jgi:WD40 repeat protein
MSRALASPATGRFTSDQDLRSGTVAFNPDGTSFATLGGDGSVELWDAETWEPEPLAEADGSTSAGALAFSPDGLTLAVGLYGAPIQLWDLRTRESTELDVGHDVSSLVFDPLGTKLAAIGVTSTEWLDLEAETTTAVTVWDLATREPISSFSVAFAHTAASFDPDGEELLLASGDDAYVRVFDAASGEPTSELDFSDEWGGTIAAFDISPRAPHDYLVCVASCLVWRQTAEGEFSPIASLDGLAHTEFTPKGDRILSEQFEEGVSVVNAADGMRVGMLPLFDMVDDLDVSPDGRTAVALTGGELQRWDLDRLAARREIRPTLHPANMSMASGWSLAVNTSPEGTETFEGRYGAAPVETYTEHAGLGSALSPDSSVAATLLDGATTVLELWDVETGETIRTIEDDSAMTTFLDFSADGSMLYAATADADDDTDTGYPEENDVVVWDVETGEELARVTVDGAWPAESVDLSPDGSTLVTVTGDGDTRLWSVADSSPVAELGGTDGQPFEARFSPDGDLIAAATSDGFAVWDTADPSAEAAVFDTGFSSSTVEFSPDGKYLAVDESYTTDFDDERTPRVTILDLDRGQIVAELPLTSTYSIHAQISISPEGDTLAFIEADGITITDIAYLREDIYKSTCEQADRDLTENEWNEYLPEFEYHALNICS